MYLPVKIIKVVPKMSFPHGPPLHLPGMPPLPPMMPPPYAVPPMGGMIPMTVGMMPGPMMAPVAMTMQAPMPMPPPPKMTMKKMNMNMHHNTGYKREQQHHHHYEPQEVLKGPPVTVFVGNITDRAPDNLIRQILQRCGIVLNWKRVQGANGKLQAFGFCEYGEPEAALRAIRLLHEWEIGNKKLVVKVDAKTKEKLDEYKAKLVSKQDDAEKKEGEEGEKTEGAEKEEKEEGETSDDTLDEATRQRDENIRSAILSIIRAHEPELSRPLESPDSPPPPIMMPSTPDKTSSKSSAQENSPKPKEYFEPRFRKNDLEDMDLEDDKRTLIHREIDKFRDTYKELILVEG